MKLELRRQAYLFEARCPSTSYEMALDRSTKLWTAYEKVNRDFFPNDPVYSTTNQSAISTTADHLAYGSAGTGAARVLDVVIGGFATASTVTRVVLQRCNAWLAAGTTAGLSLGFFNDSSPNPTGRFTSGGTQALQGNPSLLFSFNAWNGCVRWVAPPQQEIYVVNGERIAIRSSSGTPTIGDTLVIEEL